MSHEVLVVACLPRGKEQVEGNAKEGGGAWKRWRKWERVGVESEGGVAGRRGGGGVEKKKRRGREREKMEVNVLA